MVLNLIQDSEARTVQNICNKYVLITLNSKFVVLPVLLFFPLKYPNIYIYITPEKKSILY